jgi:hypothetical protein
VGALKDQELMPESEDLGLQRGSSSKALPNQREQQENERKHGIGNYSCRRSNSTGSTRTEFLVGTGTISSSK